MHLRGLCDWFRRDNTGDFSNDDHGWAELLPARRCTPAFTGFHRADWVVVGAGFTGLACAHRLAQLHPHKKIIVVDAREVGQGASGRNSGFAVASSHFSGGYSPSKRGEYLRVNRINQAGLDLLRHYVHDHLIECQWSEQGFHHVAADKIACTEALAFQNSLEALEIAHTPLDLDALNARLGTRLYKAGIHVHGGALLQPAALVRGLADALPPSVSLHENSAVLKLEESSGGVRLHLPHGEVQADKVVLATNYEAGKIGFLQRRLLGSTLSGSLSRCLTPEERASLGSLDQWGALSLHGGGATVRLTQDGRINIRNTAEYHGAALLSAEQLKSRISIHRAAFEKRFPQLAHVRFEYSWSGVEGISHNGTNFFGAQSDRIFLAGGYNGSGISRGFAFGTALGDYSNGDMTPLVRDCLASEPANWIPPRPLLDIGAYFTVRSRFRGVGLDR